MGEIVDRFAIAFRDFAVDGVPASGPNKPRKVEIKAIGSAIESRIAAAAAGLRNYATKAALDADTTRPPGTLAYVYGDPTPANNTVYHYETVGWVVDTAYYVGVAAAVQPVVDQVKVNPRPATLADANRNRILIAKGGTLFVPGAGNAGAVKVGLPAGILVRETAFTVRVRDHYGSLTFHIGGNNDSAWNYATATVQGYHFILGDYPIPVLFGNDGTRDCVWIGDTSYVYWDHLTVEVLEAAFTGNTITEAWLGEWSISLDTELAGSDNVVRPPIQTYLPLTTQHVKIDAPRLAVAMGPGAKIGTRASNYQVVIGGLAGSDSPNNFNNVFVGLQNGSQSDGVSATTLVGLQAGQHVIDVTNGTGLGIHALLAWEHGVNMTAVGAGSQEYAVNASRSTSLGAYSGRDNQANDCLFLGNNAGLYSTTEAGAFHVAKDENESLLRGNFVTRYLNVNGALASEGVKPLADNTYSLGTSELRYSVVYAGSGTISTSDERTKQQISGVPDDWLDAWGDARWVRYKFNDAVAEKGDDARWHVGLTAQQVHAAFASRGIDAFTIGLIGRDVWDEQTEPVTELRPVEKVHQRPKEVDGKIVLEMKQVGTTEDGLPIMSHVPVMEDYTDTIEQMFETGEVRVVREAGELWNLRYDECDAMEAAWNRREREREKARNDALEARIAKLEKLLG